MVGGIVAEGLKMLGYTMSTGGFINEGLKFLQQLAVGRLGQRWRRRVS